MPQQDQGSGSDEDEEDEDGGPPEDDDSSVLSLLELTGLGCSCRVISTKLLCPVRL